MKQEKWNGNEELFITCKYFKNPIRKEVLRGFRITMFDSEFKNINNPSPNEIQMTSDDIGINSNFMTEALITHNGFSLSPSIFTVGQLFTWTMAISKFPMPLEKDCWLRLTIPADLSFSRGPMTGFGMFFGFASTDISFVTKASSAGTVLEWKGCEKEYALGPDPVGRLEIN